MMLIRTEEDPLLISAAEFYAEIWGGHPGTTNKRIAVNGRSTYPLPCVGTEDGHCTYSYPSVPLKITDLVNGYQAVQFAVDQGSTFWGHMIVDNAAIRVALTNEHPDLKKAGLETFTSRVAVSARGNTWRLSLHCAPLFIEKIASVDFHGWYEGYDENGNLQQRDWHGYTKNRLPVATLGTVGQAPFEHTWETSMLPAQKDLAVRAAVRFKADINLVFLTGAARGLEIRRRTSETVRLFPVKDMPVPFWSRAGRLKTCHVELDIDPARVSKAELHVVTWTGGAGTVKDYFKLNGVHYPVAEGARHALEYHRFPVEPANLRKGSNRIELLSDTEHHGIEVMYPGPALMVRYR